MWLVYSLLGAFGKSYSGYFRKRIALDVSSSMYMWISYSFILITLTPFMIIDFSNYFRMLREMPFVLVGASASVIFATQLNFEALKREELSFTAPLNAFVPVFTVIVALILLNESPPSLGLLGVGLIVFGAYVISIKKDKLNWYDPLVRLFRSRGAQFSLGVAFFYSINTVFMKMISNQGYSAISIFYMTTLLGWLALASVPIRRSKEFKIIRTSNGFSVTGGVLASYAGGLFHILALSSTYASYATAVRRLDSIISVVLGWRYLNENSIKMKLIGSVIMTIGTIVLVMS